MGLRDAIRNNPGFADTLSAEDATKWMEMDDEVSMWDLLKRLFLLMSKEVRFLQVEECMELILRRKRKLLCKHPQLVCI